MADPLPSKIGKYEVRGALGEGGFGRVYKAYDPTVGRPVAVKVLTAQSGPDMLARFQNEATAAGNLHHENIVTIYEFGVYEGAPYIAMEYLEGSDLNQMMTSGPPLSLLDKVRIMSQVGMGLQCAHDNGVVHRDVKPANIKVLPNRAVKMMDFGIARLTRDDSTRLTQKGDLIGTIRYMSPEQFAGLDVDALCDIFAYGVIFYELVSGAHPFEASDVAAFMYKITEGNPVPLSQLVAGCPPTLQQIVMRAIEKDRDLRYQSLEDLLLDMRPLLLDLQKQRAAELFALAHDLYTAGQLTRAQAFMREIIDLDSSNPEVWELRERIQQASHRQSVRPRIDTLLKAADTDLGRRLFPEAIESLEAAAKLDPTDTDIARKIADTRQQWDGAIKAARLLSDASRELERQNLTLAERLGSEALGFDPKNAKVAKFVDTVRKDIEDRDNERRLKVALDDARRLAAVEDFDSAIEKLESLKDVRDPSGQAPALLERIRAQKLQRARQERLRSEKQALRGILKESRFSDALPRLEALCAEFPEDRDLAALLADTQQQLRSLQQAGDVARAREEAAALQSVSRFAEAEELLRRLAGQYPGDSEIGYLVQAATSAREDYDRRQKLARATRALAQLRGEYRFEEAKKALDAALREFGDDGDLLEERKKLEAEWNAHRRAERVRQSLTAARSRLAEGQCDSAMMLLKQISAEDPQNPEIQDLLQEAQGLAEIQRVTRTVDQVCAQARELAAARDFEAAAALLRRTLQTYPDDPRLEGLLDAVSRQKLEWEAEQFLREALRSSSQLIREQRYPEAIHALEAFLEKVPGEPALLKLLSQAKSEWEASKRADALSRATAGIRAAVEQNRLDEAAALIEHHSGEFGAAASFIALRSQVEEMARTTERTRRIAEAESQVRSLLNQGNREAALQVCQAAMTRDPDAPQLLEWFSGIQQQIAQDRRQAEVSRLTGLTRQAIVLKDWNAAAGRLEELGRQYPDEPSLPALRDSLRAERRREETEQALAALAEALNRRDWPTAEKRLAAAAAIAPDSPRVAEARSQIERGKRRDKAVADARSAHRKSRFDEVERLLSPVVADDAADAEAMELLRDAQSRRAAAETESMIAQGRKQAKALVKERRFDDAIRTLQGLIGAYGRRADVEQELEQISTAADRQSKVLDLEQKRKAGDAQGVLESATQLLAAGVPEAREHLRWAETAIVAAQRPSIGECLARVEGLAAAGDLDGAAAALAESLKTYPDDTELVAWKQRLVNEKSRREGIVQAKTLLSQSKFDQAATLLASLLARFPADAEAAALLKTARAGRPKAGGEAAPAPPIWKKPAVMGAFAALVLIALAAIGKMLLFPGPPSLAVTAECPAAGKVGDSYSCALKASGGVGTYRWTLASKALPPGLTLDTTGGTIGGIPTGDGKFDFAVRVSDERGHTADTSTLSLAIDAKKTEVVVVNPPTGTVTPPPPPPPPLKLETLSLPEGKVGDSYGVTLDASGGTKPYTWTVNPLPGGLSLNGSVLRGRPTAEGPVKVQVRVTDRANQTDERAFSVSMKSATTVMPLKVFTTSLPEGKVGDKYSGTLTGSGGKPPYRWSVTGLPAGLQLDPANGSIGGVPSAESKANVSVRLSDPANGTAVVSVSLVIQPPPAPAGPHCPPTTKKPMTSEEYPGEPAGFIEWKGSPGKPVLIVGKTPVEGGGSVTPQSSRLLGAPVVLEPPAGTTILEPPSRLNGWSCFVFQPGANSAKINWKVDWTQK